MSCTRDRQRVPSLEMAQGFRSVLLAICGMRGSPVTPCQGGREDTIRDMAAGTYAAEDDPTWARLGVTAPATLATITLTARRDRRVVATIAAGLYDNVIVFFDRLTSKAGQAHFAGSPTSFQAGLRSQSRTERVAPTTLSRRCRS